MKWSNLNKTWFIDIDGTLFKHNQYKERKDEILEGVLNFFNKIPDTDYIILCTARQKKYESQTKKALKNYNIKYNKIIFDLPHGERIVINDTKPRGLKTAIAINIKRDVGLKDVG